MRRNPRFSRSAKWRGLAGGCLIALVPWLSACHRHTASTPPPHATQVITPPAISSTIAAPVDIDLAQVERMLDEEIPHQLWQIDQPTATCVAPQHVHLFGARLAVTPKLQCHITGAVTRGPIVLHGVESTLVADLPILAHVEADNVGGLVNAHADGQAMAHARITLNLSRDWQAAGTVTLGYQWTSQPSVELLGRHIAFTEQADARLKPVVADLERKLPARLADLDVRGHLDDIWRRGFTVIRLNAKNPPVWLKVTPQSLSYGGYEIVRNRLRLHLALVALTQVAVGPRPADPAPTPLPAMAPLTANDGDVRLFVPVIADYAELQPVIARALAKRSTRPFVLPGLGPLDAQFANIEVYGATQGRIAIGADITVVSHNGVLAPTTGRIWFAGVPHNAPGSQHVQFTDLTVAGDTSTTGGQMLVAIANSSGMADAVADALAQNFSGDYTRLEDKIRSAVADRQHGDLVINATIDAVHNQSLQAYANGLYMPVLLTGHAGVTFAPRNSR